MSASIKTISTASPGARQGVSRRTVALSGGKGSVPEQGQKARRIASRRSLLAAAVVAPMILSRQAVATPADETDSASSPYIQELLKRTEENKDRRAQERLDNYYCRNFKDYFEFEIGGRGTSTMRGVQAKNSEKIAQWLKDHPTCQVNAVK